MIMRITLQTDTSVGSLFVLLSICEYIMCMLPAFIYIFSFL